MQKKSAGQIIAENNKNSVGPEDVIRSYTQMMQKEVFNAIQESISYALSKPYFDDKDFYIVVVINIDPVLGQPKIQSWPRRSCPTPVYKQIVFKYYRISAHTEYLWSIPDKERYYHVLHNKQKYFESKELKDMAKFVCLMESGKLLEWVKKENGEKVDAVIQFTPKE